MVQDYSIYSYFQTSGASKNITRTWAEYVDNKENGGNGNGKVDGNEISIFKNIMKYMYNYDYDFGRLDSEQNMEIVERGKNEANPKAPYAFAKGGFDGAFRLGYETAKNAIGHTNKSEYDDIAASIKAVANYPIEAKKSEFVKEFFTGYSLNSHGGNGLFEQMGSEYNSKLTYGDALSLVKTVLETVPENKRDSKEYQRVQAYYNKYINTDPNETFKNNSSGIARFFGVDELDQLDENITKLLK